MAWWHEQSSRKPHPQSSSSSSSTTQVLAALRTPPPTIVNSKLYSGDDMPALRQNDSSDWEFIIIVLGLILVIVILLCILKNLIAKVARRDAGDPGDQNDLDDISRNGERSSDQISTSISRNYAAPSSVTRRGLDSLFPTNLSLPITDSPSPKPEPDTEARKDTMTVDENIQAYLAQNGGNVERKLGMSETYARRRKREQEGYLVGF